MTLTPKITLVSLMSFISNLDSRNHFVLETISMHVPKFYMSSTYKHIVTYLPFPDLVYTYLSAKLVDKPSQSKILSSFSCHCFSACLSPYKDFKSLHVFSS